MSGAGEGTGAALSQQAPPAVVKQLDIDEEPAFAPTWNRHPDRPASLVVAGLRGEKLASRRVPNLVAGSGVDEPPPQWQKLVPVALDIDNVSYQHTLTAEGFAAPSGAALPDVLEVLREADVIYRYIISEICPRAGWPILGSGRRPQSEDQAGGRGGKRDGCAYRRRNLGGSETQLAQAAGLASGGFLLVDRIT